MLSEPAEDGRAQAPGETGGEEEAGEAVHDRELCTHPPRKSGNTIDLSTTFPWEALCAEVAKLKVQRHEPRWHVHRPQPIAHM